MTLGIPITVVMPIVAPLMKVSACRQYGANVIVTGADIGESKKHAMGISKIKGFLYINGYDHPDILAGQGTMGLEILSQVPELDACIIPVGGGGLIAGAALAIKSLNPNVQIIVLRFLLLVKCVVETRDMEHSKELERKLREVYSQVVWGPQYTGTVDSE
nr:hypothetical protein BaRGS_027873 [Batillaria attramentaria]